jgi:hypothetical protein
MTSHQDTRFQEDAARRGEGAQEAQEAHAVGMSLFVLGELGKGVAERSERANKTRWSARDVLSRELCREMRFWRQKCLPGRVALRVVMGSCWREGTCAAARGRKGFVACGNYPARFLSRDNYVAKTRFWRHNPPFQDLRRAPGADHVATNRLAVRRWRARLCREPGDRGESSWELPRLGLEHVRERERSRFLLSRKNEPWKHLASVVGWRSGSYGSCMITCRRLMRRRGARVFTMPVLSFLVVLNRHWAALRWRVLGVHRYSIRM